MLWMMEQIYRRMRVLDQMEERDLRDKLDLLEKQFRRTRKTLHLRRDSLQRDHQRVQLVRGCEPKATRVLAMRDIREQASAELQRSVSAPVNPRCSGHGGASRGSVSQLQIRRLAAIDSISDRERARRRASAREEAERLRRLQTQTLRDRVTVFIETLRQKYTSPDE